MTEYYFSTEEAEKMLEFIRGLKENNVNYTVKTVFEGWYIVED